MDEFLKLFLTGKRANAYARFRRNGTAIAVIGMLCASVCVAINLAGVNNVPISVAFSVLSALIALGCTILNRYRAVYARSLVELEHAANQIERAAEERRRYDAVYEAWTQSFGRKKAGGIFAACLYVLGHVVIAVGCAFASLGRFENALLLGACVIASIFLGVSAFAGMVSEGFLIADIYRLAEREIDEIKRKNGKSRMQISREAEIARGYSAIPRTVSLFLKEEEARADFRALNKKSVLIFGGCGFLIGVIIVVSPFFSLAGQGEAAAWWIAGAACVFAVSAMLGLGLPVQMRINAIYERNAAKLGENETDRLRARLQAAWIFQQKAGNLIFGGVLAAAVLVGAVLGLIGYARNPSTALIEQLMGCVGSFLVYGAFLSVAAWIVFYCICRRKLRPLEAELTEKIFADENANADPFERNEV